MESASSLLDTICRENPDPERRVRQLQHYAGCIEESLPMLRSWVEEISRGVEQKVSNLAAVRRQIELDSETLRRMAEVGNVT